MDEIAALDRRLERDTPAPILVAFSGGGDSLALLLAASHWARGAGRRLIAATVDHGLQIAGATWQDWCADRAARLGHEHVALAWTGAKPAGGLAAAARTARHRLLAEAARRVGARVILMGHTADDLLEAAAMRAAGLRLSSPREWAPSPAWPEGRGVFILRPLLGARRAALRERLRLAEETWIDDPANDDPRSARAQARKALAAGAAACRTPSACDRAPPSFEVNAAGAVTLTRAGARAALGAAVLCVGGGHVPARGSRLARLRRRLETDETFAATLGGARLSARGDTVRLERETADHRRSGPAPLVLWPHETAVWDGRFEIGAGAHGATVGMGRHGSAAIASGDASTVRCLVEGRLAGALGVIADEAAIWRVAKSVETS